MQHFNAETTENSEDRKAVRKGEKKNRIRFEKSFLSLNFSPRIFASFSALFALNLCSVCHAGNLFILVNIFM